MDQREVWDKVGEDWHKYRQHPVNEAAAFLQNKKGLILDLACGSGRNFVDTKGTIIGSDFSERMLSFARKNSKHAKLVKSDVLSLPFKDDSFDAILFSAALHNIRWNKRTQALRELVRVGKDGAPVFISVWNRNQPRFAHSKKEGFIPWSSKGRTYQRYYYLYTKGELETLMKKHFSNVRVYGSVDKAFKKYSKNIIAVARVAK